MLIVGNNMQAIFGTRSENLKTDIEEYLKTAGDEAELGEDQVEEVVYDEPGTKPSCGPLAAEKARDFIAGLGGKANVGKVEAAAETRLRVKVKDPAKVDEAALRNSGIAGMVKVGDGLYHLIAGANADQYAAEMRGQLASVPA